MVSYPPVCIDYTSTLDSLDLCRGRSAIVTDVNVKAMRPSRRYFLMLASGASLAFSQTRPKRVILLLGPPGAGKTTQAKKLKSILDIPAISMSEVLRREGGGKGPLNKALKKQIAGGELVSDEVANTLMRARVTRKDAENGFILDGYPATPKQAEFFDAMIADLGLPKPVVIHLSISDTEADSRLSSRGRADDSPANVERRIVEYRNEAAFILARYPGAVKTIDGSRSPEAVTQAIQVALGLLTSN